VLLLLPCAACQTDAVNSGGTGRHDDDVIRCVCNIYRDEGKMIQCERCQVIIIIIIIIIISEHLYSTLSFQEISSVLDALVSMLVCSMHLMHCHIVASQYRLSST